MLKPGGMREGSPIRVRQGTPRGVIQGAMGPGSPSGPVPCARDQGSGSDPATHCGHYVGQEKQLTGRGWLECFPLGCDCCKEQGKGSGWSKDSIHAVGKTK